MGSDGQVALRIELAASPTRIRDRRKHITLRVPDQATTSGASDSTNVDDFFLRELAKELNADEKAGVARSVAEMGGAFVLVRAVDYALDMVGPMGKEFILSALKEGDGLRVVDVLDSPGPWWDSLREILGESSQVIEMRLLRRVEEETGLRGENLTKTVELLKSGRER